MAKKRTPLQKPAPEKQWKVSKEAAEAAAVAANRLAAQKRARVDALVKELAVLKRRIQNNTRDQAAWDRFRQVAAELGAPNVRGPQTRSVSNRGEETKFHAEELRRAVSISTTTKKPKIDTQAVYADLNRSK